MPEIFGRLKDEFHNGHLLDLGTDDVEAARNLAEGMASFHQSESDRQLFFNARFKLYSGVAIETRVGKENTRTSDASPA